MIQSLAGIWSHRKLIWRLAKREFEARFRGSLLGVVWAIVIPLSMLAVYSLVFGSILGTRWPKPHQNNTDFAFPMILFLGLMLHGMVSDALGRSPGLMLESVSYVKKVVFPLEILPVVSVISSLINAGISLIIFLVIYVFLYGLPPATILLLPLILLPVVLITLGLVYFFASLGVFLRDIKHIMPPLLTVMLFLSPILFSIDMLPETYRHLIFLNPLSIGVLQLHDIVFWGRMPDPIQWLIYFAVAVMIYTAGNFWFMSTKKAFADVV